MTPPLLNDPVLDCLQIDRTMATMSSHREPAVLPDDVLIEILSLVPYSSVCRFKLVCKSWLALCSSPDVRKRSPQTLAGFFCSSSRAHGRRFLTTSGDATRRPPADPSLPFLRAFEGIMIVDSCNGLVLCRSWKPGVDSPPKVEYVVCNPATEKWLVLPPNPRRSETQAILRIHLGFEPAVSSHFTMFLFSWFSHASGVEVGIYSSEAGEWTYKQCGWGPISISAKYDFDAHAVFLNDTLHMATASSWMLTVDKHGNTWRNLKMPHTTGSGDWSIGSAQGCVYAAHVHINRRKTRCQLTVWVLEDCESERWTLKHTTRFAERPYGVLAFYPDRNLIFLRVRMGLQRKLMSYNLDTRKSHDVCSLEEYCLLEPYIPCFVEWLSDGHSKI